MTMPFIHAQGSTPFGARLKQARRERGFKVIEFCTRVGIDHTQLTGYENRGVKPNMDTLIALAQVLDCSIDFLCGLSEN